jgi:hypothetical protein
MPDMVPHVALMRPALIGPALHAGARQRQRGAKTVVFRSRGGTTDFRGLPRPKSRPDFSSRKRTVERAPGDAERRGHLLDAAATQGDQHAGVVELLRRQRPRPAALATALPRRRQACKRALPYPVRLKFRQRRENPEHQPPGGAGRVDPAGQHPQPDATPLQRAHGLDEVLQGAAEAVELPDHEHVARLEHRQRRSEARPIILPPASLIGEDAIDADEPECIALEIERLSWRLCQTRVLPPPILWDRRRVQRRSWLVKSGNAASRMRRDRSFQRLRFNELSSSQSVKQLKYLFPSLRSSFLDLWRVNFYLAID